jgi:phosphoesterase RecJ-like protein
MQESWIRIEKASHIVVTMHRRPDGDALGSALGLYNTLRAHKKVSLFNVTPELPREFAFLPGFDRIKTVLPPKFDLMVTLDSATFDLIAIEHPGIPVINIDHHQSNTDYGAGNVVDASLPSCGEVVLAFLEANGIRLNRPAALCLYTALASDTQFFATDRVDVRTFESARKLLDYGVKPAEVARHIRQNRPLSQARLHGAVLTGFGLFCDGRVASVVIDEAMQRHTGAGLTESAHVADELLTLSTVQVAVMIFVVEGQGLKVSLRGKESVNLSDLASRYGGGGHRNAAGLFVRGMGAHEFEKKIIDELRGLIDE